MFYDFIVGENTYQLKLTTKSIITLENKLGMNPLLIFGVKGDRIPQIKELLQIVAVSFTAYNHGISEDKVYDIMDAWFDEGNSIQELMTLVVEIFKVSGLYKEERKN